MRESQEVLSGNDFKRMASGAYNAFLREHRYINSLNVFPVPDGDTGTNMLLTLGAVARALSEAPDTGIGPVTKWAADSAIMGARGNSGVILAQIFRGIARGLAGKEEANSSEIAKAFQYGVLYAYRAVSRPVEGTILTVAKGIAKGARRAVRDQMAFADILSKAIEAGEKELARTPELLPVLKTAGVVDAGGQGLIVFLRGCLEGLVGIYAAPESGFDADLTAVIPTADMDMAHPYCTEFIVKHCSIGVEEARQHLAGKGDSLVVAEGPELLKVHIHTAHPGSVLESAVTWGTLHAIKIDNMADQHRHTMAVQNCEEGKNGVAVISVAPGEGIARIMRQLGAAIIIAGGQTMNPPVEDFVTAIHSGKADKYMILPNNKNIILAAQQVKKLVGDRVEFLPTVNVPQGLAALMAFAPDDDIKTNIARMQTRLADVKAGSVTVAVRDCVVENQAVKAGSYIGLIENEVVVGAAGLEEALVRTVKLLAGTGGDIATLYYGADMTESAAGALADKVAAALPEVQVELYYGGQPHYPFYISIE